MTRASDRRKAKKAVNKGGPMKLTETERLQMENLTLKIKLIQENAQKQAAQVEAARQQLAGAIGQRLGIDLTKAQHNINLDNGLVTPLEQKGAKDGNAQALN